jgi:MFS family permease
MIGNILDHYDTALYSFLCPFIAPLLFPDSDPAIGLMLGFGIGSCSFLSRPLGSLFFGRLTYSQGIKKTLPLSLWGIALSTGSIGLIPSYSNGGLLSAFLLIFARFLQGFFAAGENSLVGLYMFELVKKEYHYRLSSYYQVSSLVGIILASFTSTLVSLTSFPQQTWRIAFFIGFTPGIIAGILRFSLPSMTTSLPYPKIPPLYSSLKQHSSKITHIMIIFGFSYMTYALPFIFLNSFGILLSPNVSYSQMMMTNTGLLVFDLLLLVGLTKIPSSFSRKMMPLSALALVILIIPLFFFLENGTLTSLTIIRLIIIIIGVFFCAPLQAWVFNQIEGPDKYLVIGFAASIGKEILGRLTPFFCWGLWHITHWKYAPTFFLLPISLLAALILQSRIKK